MAEQLYRKRISPPSASNVDDMVSKNVLAQLRRDPPPRPPTQSHTDSSKHLTGASGGGGSSGTGVGSGVKGGGVDASDLISSMAKRLGTLEREMKERQALLQQVQADNAALTNKLRLAEEEIAKRALAAIEPRDDSAAVMHLRCENARLRAQLKYAWKQVEEMKSFLNDYGMVWMGEPDSEGEAGARETESGDAPSGRVGPGALQSLSPEPSDQFGPRRTSHNGAAIGPSSAAAAAAASAGRSLTGTPPDSIKDERRLIHGPSTAGGLSPAAAAALGRAGEGAGLLARADSSFNKHSNSLAPLGSASRPPTSSVPSPRSNGALSMPLSSPRALRPMLPVNLAELKVKVDELNDLAGDGCGQIVRDAAGQHVLATQDAVCLVMYRDGLQIHTLPARPYNDPASSAVLRDIMDGYFPYVLKQDFPDGVPLRVVDRTSDSICSSPSRRTGGGGPANGRVGNIHTFDDIDTQSSAAEPMSREKFLSRLPQAVIKNGKVIEIRSDISRLLAGSNGAAEGAKADVALISTPVDALLSTMQRNHLGPSLPPPSREGQNSATEVTTLQVKSMDGKQTYILKLKYDDTIGGLRACIDAHHAKAGQAGAYEIRSSFPVRAYTDTTETLRQAGLVPNATLFLRTV